MFNKLWSDAKKMVRDSAVSYLRDLDSPEIDFYIEYDSVTIGHFNRVSVDEKGCVEVTGDNDLQEILGTEDIIRLASLCYETIMGYE